MTDDSKYARYTGALTAMTRFLVNDLVMAMNRLDKDEYKYEIDRFNRTVEHAEEVLADVGEKK